MQFQEYCWLNIFSLLIFGSQMAKCQQRLEDGVRVAYELSSPITLHEPLVVRFSIKNESNRQIVVELGYNYRNSFRFGLIKPDGSQVELRPFGMEGPGEAGEILLGPMKSYSQRLALNELYEFDLPGRYRVEVRLVTPIKSADGSSVDVATDAVLDLEIRPRDEAVLRQRCEELLKEIRQSKSLAMRTELGHELSYIKDPVNIPYLEKLIEEREEITAINGLRRIGTDDAIRVVIVAAQSQDKGSAAYARGVLSVMEPKVQDPKLREQIKIILRN